MAWDEPAERALRARGAAVAHGRPGPGRGSRGRGGHGGRALDEGVGTASASRRLQLPRSLRLEGRLALVVRGAVPPPLDGGHAVRARHRDRAPAARRGGGRTRWRRTACPKTRRCSPRGPAWRAECCSMAARVRRAPRRARVRRAAARALERGQGLGDGGQGRGAPAPRPRPVRAHPSRSSSPTPRSGGSGRATREERRARTSTTSTG